MSIVKRMGPQATILMFQRTHCVAASPPISHAVERHTVRRSILM